MKSTEECHRQLFQAEKQADWGTYIRLYQEAIRSTPFTNLDEWFALRINLARIYLPLGARKAVDGAPIDFRKAIEICRKILRKISISKDSEKWAATHFFLGGIYGMKNRKANTSNARKVINAGKVIQHFSDALRIYTRRNYPYDWAIIKAGLGKAFIELGSRKDLLLAKRHYSDILQVFTQKKYPEDWRDTIQVLTKLDKLIQLSRFDDRRRSKQ